MSHSKNFVNSNLFKINVNTINIRGGLSVISKFIKTKKNIKNKKNSKNKKSQQKKTNSSVNNVNKEEKIHKLSKLYLWMYSQTNSIIVLTESKLNQERAQIFSRIFEDEFYVI